MKSGKKPKLPIKKKWMATGVDGEIHIIEVSIEQTEDNYRYPVDGIKSVFKIIRMNSNGEREVITLIDNHNPFGFHEHASLPMRVPREKIQANDWREAWKIFEERIKRIIS